MAEFRTIQTKMWRDEWFSSLDSDGRVLWMYLITNPSASVAGIYRLPDKFIAFDTGINVKRLAQLKVEFKTAGRIDFDGDVIWVKKMREYQDTGSPKVKARIKKDVDEIPNCRVKGIYCQKYGIDTVCIPYLESMSDTDTDTDTDTVTETDTLSPDGEAQAESRPPREDSGTSEKMPRARTVRDDVVAHLESVFCAETNLSAPPRDSKKAESAKRWWNPLWSIYEQCGRDADVAEACIRQAVQNLRAKRMTISAPGSIEKTAVGIFGENGGSRRAAPSDMVITQSGKLVRAQ